MSKASHEQRRSGHKDFAATESFYRSGLSGDRFTAGLGQTTVSPPSPQCFRPNAGDLLRTLARLKERDMDEKQHKSFNRSIDRAVVQAEVC